MVVACALAMGCASVQTALDSKDKGTVEVYPIDESQAWTVAHRVFRWEGADAIEDDRANNVMVTSSGFNAVSYGTVMACWIEPIDGAHTKITIVTKRRYQLGLFTTLTESTFQRRFQQAVDLLKAGKPLPLTRPKAVAKAKVRK